MSPSQPGDRLSSAVIQSWAAAACQLQPSSGGSGTRGESAVHPGSQHTPKDCQDGSTSTQVHEASQGPGGSECFISMLQDDGREINRQAGTQTSYSGKITCFQLLFHSTFIGQS